MSDRHTLLFRPAPASSTSAVPLPHHIERLYVPTPVGTLELLSAQPAKSDGKSRKKAILFQHGGFGYASVWIPFLTYLSQEHNYPCYALSLRGHGASWKPSFMSMVWGTSKAVLAQDLNLGMKYVKELERERRGGMSDEELVLVGHSAGGGLSQFFLSEGIQKVGGLIVVAGFPCFGGWRVYLNWFKLDPWFLLRYYILDFLHPRSPLSSTTLVHRAFFSSSFPLSSVKPFEQQMPEYESMIWPFGMMFPFVNTSNVAQNVLGWKEEGKEKTKRILVIAGEEDKLMTVVLMRKMAAMYRSAVEKLGLGGGREQGGVGFEVIAGSGHHLQNDVNWEEGAKVVLEFMEQL